MCAVFQATGIWPLWPGEVLEHTLQKLLTLLAIDSTIPIKVAKLRKHLFELIFTPHTCTVVDEYSWYIDPTSKTLKVLCSGMVVKASFMKQLQGPRTLDGAYVDYEKACMAKQEVEKGKTMAKAEKRAVQWTA